ncbi:type I restriction-modification system subunit M [Ruegeria faecimaris]|uniref:type I restriction-modification system subunit M n=1 Tax=Ruegeria faecimaris TaxID=686389 RepID=UPI002490CBC9|nr:class I SAM-dependent DNA methyltransferase [Ruegeria faecimaris]
MSQSTNNLASYIWSLADLLRGDFKQSQYGRIILPFTLLRRLECVLKANKAEVLAQADKLANSPLPEEAKEKILLRASKLSFYNTSKMDLASLGASGIKDNLESYIQSFSTDAREIFEHFKFGEFIAQLDDANLLYKAVQQVKSADLRPEVISNHDMGLVFEELIRRFAESSNETAGEHFTPRDIVDLTTSLVFMEDDEALTKEGIIRTIYDPTAGTGGFLSAGMEYVLKLNPAAVMRAFGQELNPESYAICKADMLIKGQDVTNIKLGNTLSQDQLASDNFDYMLSNPPFGVDWKKIEKDIKDEHAVKGFDGRFGPGLPRVSDGSLLFLMHLISKLRDTDKGGGRIGIILNGSPLFTGGAGSGESEIRRHILESDLLEAIIALPTDMFYNTGIATYVWVLTNKKAPERKGNVQLINGVDLFGKMRKSLGSKRKRLEDSHIATITRCFGGFEAVAAEETSTFASKIFETHEFGYRRLTIERPLRESYQFSDDRIETLRFAPKPLNAITRWIYDTYGKGWDEEGADYGVLDSYEDEIRTHIKAEFAELKETQIKDALDPRTWRRQLEILKKARELKFEIGPDQHDDMNLYDKALKATGVRLDTPTKKQITAAVSWKNPKAEKVVKKVHKDTGSNPTYGLFEVNGQTIEYKPDGDLRDYENVPLDPSQSTNSVSEAYFAAEVTPHVPDAWIDGSKVDAIDGEIGIVGYEIPFNRHFYTYNPPRDLAEIDADLDAVSAEIMALLQEVHA